MAQIETTDLRGGAKIIVEGQPYTVISNEFVKPGKGQSFNRVKMKHILTSRSIEVTFKSGSKVDVADIVEANMRMLFKENDGVIFMDDTTYDQHKISNEVLGDTLNWLMEDLQYGILFYQGVPVSVEPPTFLTVKITETAPGVRGNTASGRVMKPATIETGAKIQVPIFVEEGEMIKVDTRTGEYVARV